MSVIPGAGRFTLGKLGEGKIRQAQFFYDFAVDGGAVSAITLRGDTVPNGAVVVDVIGHVATALTGATATVALHIQSAADINAAAAISGAPWSTTGGKRFGAFTATTAPLTLTAARSVVATVGTAALTAGKFSVVVFYMEF
jgi:hypothetical protein